MINFTKELPQNQSVTYRYREFVIFLVVSEPVSEKIGSGKKSRNRYGKYLVPEKVAVSVSFNILGTVTHCPEHNCDSIRTLGAVFKKFQWQRHLEAVYDIRSG